MFTGIIEQTATVLDNIALGSGRRLLLKASIDAPQLGESIAVDGVCLTLLASEPGQLAFDVSPETLSCTTLGNLSACDLVNLERAMSATARFGGHYVSGHVDKTFDVLSMDTEGDFLKLSLSGFTQDELKYMPAKGSITVNGVSLTINKVEKNAMHLLLVPHTLAKTTLGQLKTHDRVNIEFDYLAKMVSHQVRLAIENED